MKGPTQKEYDHIDLILTEANKKGLKKEVERLATKYIKGNPDLCVLNAYQMSFKDVINSK